MRACSRFRTTNTSEHVMPSVTVKFKYSSSGGTPNVNATKSVVVSRKPPTESEVMAELKKANPKWNIVIVEIK